MRRIVEGVVYGADEAICEMVRQRIPLLTDGFQPGTPALGVFRHGKLLGGVVFDLYTGRDIVMSAAFDSPAWCTRKILKRLFSYPFVQLGCRRMTTITTVDNEAALSLDRRLGFVEEGRLRKAFPGDTDAIVLGMLREECKWLGD